MKMNRVILTDFLHLFVLVAFALAQPVYDLLGRNPEFFVSHKADPGQIFALVSILSIGVALSLVLLELLMWLMGETIRRVFHWVMVFGLVALIVLPPLKRLLGEHDVVIMGIAIFTGLFFTLFYARWQGMRLFVTVLSPAAVAFPLWFLFATPVSRLVMPDAIGAQADVEIHNPVPVVLVVMDEFNITALLNAGGRIDPVRYPNFAALAEESWWFPNAVAASAWTERAVPAILTGRQPRIDVRLNPTATDHPQNLFTILGEHYHLNVMESLTLLCPDMLCRQEGDAVNKSPFLDLVADVAVIYLHIITPPQMGKPLPSLEAKWRGFGGALLDRVSVSENGAGDHRHPPGRGHDREQQLNAFLSRLQRHSGPELHFLHILLPHVTYEFLATGHKYFPSDGRQFLSGIVNEAGGWIGEKPLILTAYHRYLQQIGYLDRFLGELRQKLHASQLYDDSLIILTADHGVAFQTGMSRREVEKGNETDILKVPMFVKLPGQHEGQIRERLVSGIDVLPTIVEILGVRTPGNLEGYSMVSDSTPSRTEIEIPNVGKFKAADLEGFPRLKWQIDHFAQQSSLDRLVPKGPHPDLIGEALADFPVEPSPALQYQSEDIGYLSHVNPDSGFLPALFRGHILSPDEHQLPLAIALNGRIWATTTTSEWDGKSNYFSVLLPPAAFKEGRNVLGVYRIGGPGTRLLSINRDDERPEVKLQWNPLSSMKLLYSDRREIPVQGARGIMQGSIDSVSINGNMLVFVGWGADLKEKRPAEEVLIFSGGELVSRSTPGSTRQDVADAHHQQDLVHSGFDALVPVRVLQSLRDEIRVVLVSQGDRSLQLFLNDEQKDVIRAALKEGVVGP